MEQFVTVDRAKKLLDDHIMMMHPSRVPISVAHGFKLAEDIVAPRNVPNFLQSSMDGYAILFDKQVKAYKIIGQIQAGQQSDISIHPGEAIRIFTGAALPLGADTVVVQEKVSIQHDLVVIEDESFKKGDHVRAIGSEIPKGAIALENGMILNAASIGVLASLGYQYVNVIPPPSVLIIVTGDEIKIPGEEVQAGQVYDASSFTLTSILKKIGCNTINVKYVKDNLDELTAELKQGIESSDVVMVTGGVSVGDYDFTKKAFDKCDIQSIFHKIKQKPGKPILFGTFNGKPVFGLPGNPASVLTCFYQYVYPSLGKMMGKDFYLPSVLLKLSHDYEKSRGLTHFLKAFAEKNEVKILTGQESYKISSFAMANAFVVLGEEVSEIKKGQQIEVQFIPF